jgi:hypothetical protein
MNRRSGLTAARSIMVCITLADHGYGQVQA